MTQASEELPDLFDNQEALSLLAASLDANNSSNCNCSSGGGAAPDAMTHGRHSDQPTVARSLDCAHNLDQQQQPHAPAADLQSDAVLELASDLDALVSAFNGAFEQPLRTAATTTTGGEAIDYSTRNSVENEG